MSRLLYENHRGSRTLTLLNVLGVLGVLNVLHVLHVLHVLNMPMDASLACWALFFFHYFQKSRLFFFRGINFSVKYFVRSTEGSEEWFSCTFHTSYVIH